MREKKWSDKLITDIVNNINDPGHLIVPIIGTGVYHAIENGKNYNIQEFIIKKILEEDDCSIKCTEENIIRFSQGYRGMTQLSKLCGGAFCRLVRDALLNKANQAKIEIDSDVLTFLEQGHFPLILTTCNFCYLEQYLKYDGKQYEVVPYRKGKDQDIETTRSKLVHPTIYHLFGYAGQNENVVYTEEDFLNYLHCLQDTNTRPDNLKEYLKNRYILSLGCDIPDWTFRFLLYSLKEKNGSLTGRGDDKIFDGGALSNALDEDLAYFLSDISYYSDSDLNSFLKDINTSLAPKDCPSIFLSVNSEDYKTFGATIKSILSRKFKVWLFDDDGDKLYWKSIEEAIEHSDYFMPVTTNYSISKFFKEEAKTDIKDVQPGLVKELRIALEHQKKNKKGQKYCIPYVAVPEDLLKNALQLGHCKDLWPLFYSEEGTQHINTRLEELTAEEILEYIK